MKAMRWIVLALVSIVVLEPQARPADDTKPEEVALKDLLKDKEKWHGKLVKVKGVVKDESFRKPKSGGCAFYLKADGEVLNVYAPSTVYDLKNGDEVVVTGTFYLKDKEGGSPTKMSDELYLPMTNKYHDVEKTKKEK
jgi:hypothetical protein